MIVDSPASGRFLLRLDPELHDRLRREASARGVSLNALCNAKLATPGPTIVTSDPLTAALDRARAIVGRHWIGGILHGSVARGESTASSDVDLLIVADDGLALSPDLYRAWDAEAPLGRIEPSFVHLPTDASAAGALWAEVALDGIVLDEQDLRVSRWLIAVRREIAHGRLRRRTAHGQPYWVRLDEESA